MSLDRATWNDVRLGDILTPIENLVLLDNLSEYITITVKRRHGGLEPRERILGHEIKTKKQYGLLPGAFIISRVQCWHQAYAVVPEDVPGNMIASQNYDQFTISPQVDRRYFWWFSHSPLFTETVRSSAFGVVIEKMVFNRDAWLEKKIPLPPLDEQRRIVLLVDELAAKVLTAHNLRVQAADERFAFLESAKVRVLSGQLRLWQDDSMGLPGIAGKVRRGVLIPPVLNPVAASWSVPKNWLLISVAELLLRGVLHDVKDGNHGENHPKASEFCDRGIPFLMARDVREGSVQWDSAAKLADNTVGRLRVGIAKAGDVLFTHKASIGRTAVAERDCILSPQVTYYRCNSDFLDAHWLSYFLSSSVFLSQLEDVRTQSTRDFVSIGKQYGQFILVPPLKEQRRIVVYLDDLRAKVDCLKKLQSETSVEFDALMPSILSRAFRGEL